MRRLLVKVKMWFWAWGFFLPEIKVIPFASVWAQWGKFGYELYDYKGYDGRYFFFMHRKSRTIIWKQTSELRANGFEPFLLDGGKRT